jgi:hypothetical protein
MNNLHSKPQLAGREVHVDQRDDQVVAAVRQPERARRGRRAEAADL